MRPILLADVGGTHARFALLDEQGDISPLTQFYCARYPSLLAAASVYLQQNKTCVSQAVFAVAAPVHGDTVRMTNHSWVLNKQKIQAGLKLEDVTFINDFYALAYAIPTLTQNDMIQIGGEAPKPKEPMVVLGPGTGLGVSAVFWRGDTKEVQGSEGGHVDFAPQNAFEQKLWEYLVSLYGHVSVERILSGQGLVDLAAFYGELNGIVTKHSAAEIVTQALAGLSPGLAVLNHFCGMLGAVAGNFALTFNARGGVYLGGGMVPRFVSFLTQSPFREQFEAKGRFTKNLTEIPVFIIMDKAATIKGAWAIMTNRFLTPALTSTSTAKNGNICSSP